MLRSYGGSGIRKQHEVLLEMSGGWCRWSDVLFQKMVGVEWKNMLVVKLGLRKMIVLYQVLFFCREESFLLFVV